MQQTSRLLHKLEVVVDGAHLDESTLIDPHQIIQLRYSAIGKALCNQLSKAVYEADWP